MKTKKLDKSVSRHFAERKVFYKKPLTKILEQQYFPGHREQNLRSVIYFCV